MKMKLIAFALLILIACKKENRKADNVVFQSRQSQVAAITKEVAEILQQVYTDQQAYMEVNAAIYRGHYYDERILLKDLLKRDTSRFRQKFCEIIERGNYPILTSELSGVLKLKKGTAASSNIRLANDSACSVLSTVNPIAIYFPYSENFVTGNTYDTVVPDTKLTSIPRPTLVYTDREDDNVPGKKPYFCTTSPDKICYMDVLVNDEYAELFPTHIVTVGAVVRTDTPTVLKTDLVTRAYHGSSRLTRQRTSW